MQETTTLITIVEIKIIVQLLVSIELSTIILLKFEETFLNNVAMIFIIFLDRWNDTEREKLSLQLLLRDI